MCARSVCEHMGYSALVTFGVINYEPDYLDDSYHFTCSINEETSETSISYNGILPCVNVVSVDCQHRFECFVHHSDNILTCGDGTSCFVENESDINGINCCSERGGTVACPISLPHMCELPNKCGNGANYCCGRDENHCQALGAGGIRQCGNHFNNDDSESPI
eukprot:UN30229